MVTAHSTIKKNETDTTLQRCNVRRSAPCEQKLQGFCFFLGIWNALAAACTTACCGWPLCAPGATACRARLLALSTSQAAAALAGCRAAGPRLLPPAQRRCSRWPKSCAATPPPCGGAPDAVGRRRVERCSASGSIVGTARGGGLAGRMNRRAGCAAGGWPSATGDGLRRLAARPPRRCLRPHRRSRLSTPRRRRSSLV